MVTWNCVLSLLYFPRTSCPLIVTSETFPWFTSDINCERLISLSFWPPLLFLTTCHSRKADNTMTSQNTTVLTVEFTGTPLNRCAKIHGRSLLDAEQAFSASSAKCVPGSTQFICYVFGRLDEINGPFLSCCAESRPSVILLVSGSKLASKSSFF